MRQAAMGRTPTILTATTMSETDANRRRHEEGRLAIQIDPRVLPGGLGGPRVESTHAFF
jgi:hypothetical protein